MKLEYKLMDAYMDRISGDYWIERTNYLFDSGRFRKLRYKAKLMRIAWHHYREYTSIFGDSLRDIRWWFKIEKQTYKEAQKLRLV